MNLSFKYSIQPRVGSNQSQLTDPQFEQHTSIPSVSSAFLPVSQNHLLILLNFRIIPPENSWVLGEFMLPFSSLLIQESRRGRRLALGSIISFLQPRPSCTLMRKTVSVQSRSFAPAVSFKSLLVFTLTLGLLGPFPQPLPRCLFHELPVSRCLVSSLHCHPQRHLSTSLPSFFCRVHLNCTFARFFAWDWRTPPLAPGSCSSILRAWPSRPPFQPSIEKSRA